MRATLFLIIALFLFSGIAMAQNPAIVYADTASRDAIDTSGVYMINALGDVSVFYEVTDTMHLTSLWVDYRTGFGNWVQAADTTTADVEAGYSKGVNLRGNGVNLIPGGNSVRFRILYTDDDKNDADGYLRIYLFRQR